MHTHLRRGFGKCGRGYAHSLTSRVWEVVWGRVCTLTYVECLGSVGEGMHTHLRRGFGK